MESCLTVLQLARTAATIQSKWFQNNRKWFPRSPRGQSSKPRCVQAVLPPVTPREKLPCPCSPFSAGSWCSWACGSLAPISAFSSTSHIPFPCVCVCSFPVSCETTHHWILIQGILTLLHLQRPLFQKQLHSKVPGGHVFGRATIGTYCR